MASFEKGSMTNLTIRRKQIELLLLRFIVAVVLKLVIKQTLYETIGKQILLSLVIYRLFYRFAFQKILYHVVIIKIPSWLVQLILFLIFKTSTITIIGETKLKEIENEKEGVIFTFWHGNYTSLLVSLRIRKAVALVDSSFRGDYIAQLASAFNYRIARTPKGGRSIQQFIRAIKQGHSGFIAVDGPQGPPHETKPGTLYIARKLGVKIIPIAVEVQRRLQLRKRWDNHCLPLPFGNITVSIGNSITVKAEDSLEAKGQEVTRSLFELSEAGKKRCCLL